MELSLTNERINAQGSLNLTGSILSYHTPLARLFAKRLSARPDKISDVDILTTQIGLLCQGRTHYEDVELYRRDEAKGFSLSMGIEKIPSEPTLRHGLEALAGEQSMCKIEGVNLAIFKDHQISPLSINGRFYIPYDIDVTPMDNTGSNRENVGRTYKGCDGFAPIMSNLGTEGWLAHHEFRPGIQHCQKGTPEFLKRNAQLLNKLNLNLNLKHPVLHRLDAGNDSEDTLEELRSSGNYFLIKRNLRRENKVNWLSHAKWLRVKLKVPEKAKKSTLAPSNT